MKNFNVKFYLNGQSVNTTIQANSQAQAITLIKAQYPKATTIYAVEAP